MSVALSLRDVRVRRGDRLAVDGVSLDVRRGEVVGVAGPNGAGKSTLLAAAAGAIDPTEGTVAVEGVTRTADPVGFAGRVGYVPAACALYDELTAGENLSFFGRLYGLAGRELRRRVVRTLSRLGVGDRAGVRVGALSAGQRQRVNLAAALVHDPPVLVLDEPTAALDLAARDALFADLDRLRDDGHAVLFSTRQWDEVDLIGDRVAVLERGKITATGTPRELARRGSAERAVLYGHLRAAPPRFLVRAVRQRLGPSVEVEVTGRRLRLAADSGADLGRALALVLTEGVEVETFHTPPAVAGTVAPSGVRP